MSVSDFGQPIRLAMIAVLVSVDDQYGNSLWTLQLTTSNITVQVKLYEKLIKKDIKFGC